MVNVTHIVVSAKKRRGRIKRKRCANAQNLSHYNILTFLPKFVFEQFTQLSTIYFLVIAILQQIPDFSPTGRWGTVLTLSCLLSLSMIKEIIEDLRRRGTDIKINHRKTTVYVGESNNSDSGSFRPIKWQHVNVGDLLEICRGDIVPADAVILSSSEPLGVCYLDTSSLDGESNLKIRQAPSVTSKVDPDDLDLVLEVSGGSSQMDLGSFVGTLRLQTESPSSSSSPSPAIIVALDLGQFLPRGATLVNTEWVLVAVVATGHGTKQLMNAMASSQRKRSSFDDAVNRIIGILLACLVLACLAMATVSAVMAAQVPVDGVSSPFSALEFLGSLVRFAILFHNVIPVSLLATVQMVRFVQAHHIRRDRTIFSEAYKDKAPEVQNSQLNEMLGQVAYVFTDKTGTVTKNRLTFRKCCVGGRQRTPERDAPAMRAAAATAVRKAGEGGGGPTAEEALLAKNFFTAISLCHTVVPGADNVLVGSPDEKAVLQGAKRFGLVWFKSREEGAVVVLGDCSGSSASYEVLHVHEYTSERRKMTVVVRERSSLKIIVLTKGADSAVFPLIGGDGGGVDAASVRILEEFASGGLRTMCYAMKELNASDYGPWASAWSAAAGDSGATRKRSMAAAFDAIERDLTFLGITAVEDELQENVAVSMKELLAAGIKVWMLSGDRQENAVSIAKSSGLLSESTPLLLLPDCSLDECREITRDHIAWLAQENLDKKSNNIALVMSGRTIGQCRDCPTVREFVSGLCRCSSTVICYRVDPWQKAELVVMTRASAPDAVVLAIGDGSNDVPMLQAAHIGVAISGVPDEHIQVHGSEATCVADYSIAEYAGLPRLIFVHGVWNSIRMGKMVCYFFYKNVAFYLVQFWYLSSTNWSGQILFDSLSITLFNLLFTALPPFVLGLFDCRNLPPPTTPSQHTQTISSCCTFGLRTLAPWLCLAIYHSLAVFYLSQFSLQHNSGAAMDSAAFSQCCYTTVLLVVCLKAVLESSSLSLLSVLVILLSLVLYLSFCVVANFVHVVPAYPGGGGGTTVLSSQVGVFGHLVEVAGFWGLLGLVPVACLLPDTVLKVWSTMWASRSKAVSLKENQDEMATLHRMSKTLPRLLKSRGGGGEELDHNLLLSRGFVFSETTTSCSNACETDCVKAYSNSLNKPKKRRPSTGQRRTKSNV